MSSTKLQEWIADRESTGWYAYVKRLSATETGANGGKGSGVYIPASVSSKAFPSILRRDTLNPDYTLKGQVSSHDLQVQEIRAVYYNSKFSENRPGGRDEQRITRWKQGVDYAPLLDHENTGALVIFAFQVPERGGDIDRLQVWVCQDIEEEDYVEGIIGEVLPAITIFKPFHELLGGQPQLPLFEKFDNLLPDAWSTVFPTGADIVDFVIRCHPYADLPVDKRLLRRREKEYAVFQTVEDIHSLPLIKKGFASLTEFIATANSITNRRKARAGRSLELHLERIFQEEGLTRFDTQVATEGNKKPDFLFPGIGAYRDANFPDNQLAILAVKTTLKDRWRQILNEANRIPKKHLFTLQEGVSESQYQEMQSEGVQLVIPQQYRKKYPKKIRASLMNLEEFITHIKKVGEEN